MPGMGGMGGMHQGGGLPRTGNSESVGESKLKGALQNEELHHQIAQRKIAKHRRRVNCLPALGSLLLPWGLYLGVYGCSAFYPRFVLPLTTVTTITLLWVVSVWYLYSVSRMVANEEALFYRRYISVAFFVAITFGFLFGSLTFWEWMQPAFEVSLLATYTNVNPSQATLWSGEAVPTQGSRYQDSGKVYFSHKAKLDGSRSMSFKMGDTYCVAPIVDPECGRNCGHDFWAVGVNCCSEDAADFRCGDYKNKNAKAGVRMMIESRRPMYRLAVLQAEGVHQLKSMHPLFFYWMQDPVKEIRQWQRQGYRRFLVTMFMSFFINAMALGCYIYAKGRKTMLVKDKEAGKP